MCRDGRSVRHTVGFARVALAVRTTSISGHAASGARRRRRFSCRWGLQSSDPGVELRSLLPVDPPGWCPFRCPSPLMRQVQLLQEVGVVW